MPLSTTGTVEKVRRAPARTTIRHIPGEVGIGIVLFGDLSVLHQYRCGEGESLFGTLI